MIEIHFQVLENESLIFENNDFLLSIKYNQFLILRIHFLILENQSLI